MTIATINTVIVEDERHSLERLKDLLKEFPQIRLVGEAADGESAITLIQQLKPALVFLDIHLPEASGFEVLARLENRPRVIFITAYDQYAIKAFEENAVDYLLKPTSRERLQKAVARVLSNEQPAADKTLELLKKILQRDSYKSRFSIKLKEEILIIPEEAVYYFKAEEKYVFLCTRDQEFFYDATLGELEKSLDPHKFVRIHKSHIVALDKIKKLKKWFLSDYLVELSDSRGTKLKTGRAYLPELKQKLNF